MVLLQLWRAHRGSGLAPGPLPDPGGLLDQAAWTMDAFRILDAAAETMKPQRDKPPHA